LFARGATYGEDVDFAQQQKKREICIKDVQNGDFGKAVAVCMAAMDVTRRLNLQEGATSNTPSTSCCDALLAEDN